MPLSQVLEAGQLSKGLLILAAQKLKTKGVPISIWIAQLIKDLSSLLYKRAKKVVEEKVNVIRQDIIAENLSNASAAVLQPSSEIVLREEEGISINERLAEEIIQNGIECKAIPDTGSLPIEKKPYYSYLFPMSPRIVTNRGCIRLEGNNDSKRNVDLIQIIQRN